MRLEFLAGYGMLLGYFIVCALGALVVRRLVRMPAEVFRKILHFILLGSILVFAYGFSTWWLAAAAAVTFMAMVFPVLALAERTPGYSELLVERKRGEIKRSLVVVFSMFAGLIGICWGWLGEKYLVIASIFAWGFGDAAAALVGKRFGRHYIEGMLVEGRKSLEGTVAMFLVSFVTVLVVLLTHGSMEWYAYVPTAMLTAAVCALVELYTIGGMDTLTCPFAAATILISLSRFWEV
ncbi:MAG: phosphatidate cytidylyltransferase [Firmicutes bacterium]|nr:phosphatidate cytidylyltransferase [Bacillota bacterium]